MAVGLGSLCQRKNQLFKFGVGGVGGWVGCRLDGLSIGWHDTSKSTYVKGMPGYRYKRSVAS